MRLIPESAAEFGSNIRWSMEKLFRLIKELPPHPRVSGTGAPGVEEAMERIERAVERRDREAEDEAIEDCMRAQVSELLQGFPQLQRLTHLLERTARREEGRGSPDSRRRPSRSEILELARALLADIGDTKRLDSEWESESVSIVLGDLRLPPIGAPSPETLQQYIELSGDSRVHFDALEHMYEVLDNRGQAMPRQLREWRHGAGGGRGRPAKKRAPPQRPVTLATLLRNLQIQVTIEILRMVGVPPRGTDVSGCRIVSEVLRELADGGLVPKALGLSEEHVKRIWKEGAFEDVMRKLPEAIAERNGPFNRIPDRCSCLVRRGNYRSKA